MPAPALDPLHQLADAAGLARQWRDVEGRENLVPDEGLRLVLTALGHPCDSERQVAASLVELAHAERQLPQMLVADAGKVVTLNSPCRLAEATGADGKGQRLDLAEGGFRAPDKPGYYALELDGRALHLAVAPPHCPLPDPSRRRPWGTSVQIPALRGQRESSFGNFGELAEAIQVLARAGADVVAINPVHALFPGNGHGFSPYSPSSRRFMNGAMGDPALVGLPPLPEEHGGPLIDWEQALPSRLAQLRHSFAALPDALRAEIAAEGVADPALYCQAVFDALDCHLRPTGKHGWRQWPAALRDPASAAVADFAGGNAGEVEFHLFCQWLARTSQARVQQLAREAGMAVGLLGDLAVGVDPSGSDCWMLGDAMLQGLTIGAPPDPLGPLGQNWSITGFSPEGLRARAYAPFIDMLRANMASCGGLRIDHAFGLARLWVIPEGGTSADGVYLSYPFADLVRLVTLEAHMAGALVVAEDLGTAPPGYTHAIREHRMLGMQVLWFQRAEDDGFIGAQDYDPLAVAMTGTHDTATVAGWWRGTDLDWAADLGRLPAGLDRAGAESVRDWDRGLLWSTLAHDRPRPSPENPLPVVEAALDHIGRTPCAMAIAPLEDLLGLDQQPNLPGTVTEHPNWRRRLDAPLDQARLMTGGLG